MNEHDDLLQQAHDLSIEHRDTVDSSAMCGCYFCISTFKPECIIEWCDNNQTALCPQCGVDAVLPESELYNVANLQFLRDMHLKWFDMGRLTGNKSR